jgi:hypothetical protein
MSFIAYLYESDDATPYMEVLVHQRLDEAKLQARRLLAEHVCATYAEVWQDDRCVFSTLPAGAAAHPH